MTSRDIPTDHISKAMVIDLLEKQKDAHEIVDLWNRYVGRNPKKGEEGKHDRLGNLGGVWSLKGSSEISLRGWTPGV